MNYIYWILKRNHRELFYCHYIQKQATKPRTFPLSFLVKILHFLSCSHFSWEAAAIHLCAFQAEMHTWGQGQESVETHIQPCSRKRMRKGRMGDVIFQKSKKKLPVVPLGCYGVWGLEAVGNSWGVLCRASQFGSLSIPILSFCIYHTDLRHFWKLLQICKGSLYRN